MAEQTAPAAQAPQPAATNATASNSVGAEREAPDEGALDGPGALAGPGSENGDDSVAIPRTTESGEETTA